MTYDEAMRLIENDRSGRVKVRRPHWDKEDAVGYYDYRDEERFYDDDCPVEWLPTLWNLDNAHGWDTGCFEQYYPTAEDKQATDWELYDQYKLYPPGTKDDA
jgi:hypothetical protein